VGYYFLRAIYDIRFKLRMHFRVTFITKQAELVVRFSAQRLVCEMMDVQFDVDCLTGFTAKLIILLGCKLGGVEAFLCRCPMRTDQILPIIFITKYFQFFSEGTSPVPVNRLSLLLLIQ